MVLMLPEEKPCGDQTSALPKSHDKVDMSSFLLKFQNFVT